MVDKLKVSQRKVGLLIMSSMQFSMEQWFDDNEGKLEKEREEGDWY